MAEPDRLKGLSDAGLIETQAEDHLPAGSADAHATASRTKVQDRQLSAEEWTWLQDNAEDMSALFQLVTPPFVGESKGSGRRNGKHLQLAWLVGDGSPFTVFQRALLSVLNRPHTRLVHSQQPMVPAEASELDHDRTDDIVEWYLGRSPFLPSIEAIRTTLTIEHRVIGSFLLRLRHAIRCLEREMKHIPVATLKEIHPDLMEELRGRRRDVGALIGLPFLAGTVRPGFALRTTSVFVHNPAYRRLYECMASFERLPEPRDDCARLLLRIATLKRWRLFELWCLFRIRDALQSSLQEQEYGHSWFDNTGAIRLTWDQEEEMSIEWQSGCRLRYQPTFRPSYGSSSRGVGEHSIGLTLRPDFVVEVPGLSLVMDAKAVGINHLGHLGGECKADDPPPYCRPLLPWHQAHVYASALHLGSSGRKPKAVVLLVPWDGGNADLHGSIAALFEPCNWSDSRVGGLLLSTDKGSAAKHIEEALRIADGHSTRRRR